MIFFCHVLKRSTIALTLATTCLFSVRVIGCILKS